MSILRKAFKIFNGSSWDEYHLKTDSKQVIHTKADGTDTTVEEQLLALNSTLNSNTVINRSFPNYEKCKLVTTSTKKGIKFEQFGYLLVKSWISDGKSPNVELWINSVKIYQSFSDYNNGLFYPISPSTWADFYVNAGSAQLYFIPCYA